MKRTGTLTVPYTFCLFCGLVALVLLMAGTFAWQVRRDLRVAEPSIAATALHGAIAPVVQQMERLVDPSLEQLGTIRRWAASGVLPEHAPSRWPEVVIPVLASNQHLQSLMLVKENGTRFMAFRDGPEWSGSIVETAMSDNSVQGKRWDASGLSLNPVEDIVTSADPRENDWYVRAMAQSGREGEAGLVSETRGKNLTLSAPLRFSGGHRGCLALVVDCSPLWQVVSRLKPVELMLDPGALRLGQLQNEPMAALLATQALPGTNSGALGQLYPSSEERSDYWYAAQTFAVGGASPWGVIARVRKADLPSPSLPVLDYLLWTLSVGLAGALLLALLFGHRITRPLRQVAARAKGIHLLDEHYLPWPRSRFTEVNVLTAALEEIYETAVEHLDYHEAPLIVWAEPEERAAEGMIEADAVRHVFQFPRGTARVHEAEVPTGTVIDVAGAPGEIALPQAIPAAQLQLLQGTRKEVRRLQSQLAGACEELRTADNHYQQDLARMRRQRNCLRGLERLLLTEGCASVGVLAQVRETLGASRVSLWTTGKSEGEFQVSGHQGNHGDTRANFLASRSFLALLQSEGLITVQEPASDPRLCSLSSHPFFEGLDDPRLLAPIKLAGRLLGFLLIERAAGLGRWKGDEELFAMGVANASAGVLWHQLRRPQEKELGTITAISTRRNGSAANGKGTQSVSTDSGRRIRRDDGAIYWEVDRAGCIKSISGEVEALYGRTREQLIGQPITFLSDGAQGQRDMACLALLLAGERCKSYETCHIAGDGTAVHLTVRAKIWRDAGDRIVGARGTVALVRAAIAS